MDHCIIYIFLFTNLFYILSATEEDGLALEKERFGSVKVIYDSTKVVTVGGSGKATSSSGSRRRLIKANKTNDADEIEKLTNSKAKQVPIDFHEPMAKNNIEYDSETESEDWMRPIKTTKKRRNLAQIVMESESEGDREEGEVEEKIYKSVLKQQNEKGKFKNSEDPAKKSAQNPAKSSRCRGKHSPRHSSEKYTREEITKLGHASENRSETQEWGGNIEQQIAKTLMGMAKPNNAAEVVLYEDIHEPETSLNEWLRAKGNQTDENDRDQTVDQPFNQENSDEEFSLSPLISTSSIPDFEEPITEQQNSIPSKSLFKPVASRISDEEEDKTLTLFGREITIHGGAEKRAKNPPKIISEKAKINKPIAVDPITIPLKKRWNYYQKTLQNESGEDEQNVEESQDTESPTSDVISGSENVAKTPKKMSRNYTMDKSPADKRQKDRAKSSKDRQNTMENMSTSSVSESTASLVTHESAAVQPAETLMPPSVTLRIGQSSTVVHHERQPQDTILARQDIVGTNAQKPTFGQVLQQKQKELEQQNVANLQLVAQKQPQANTIADLEQLVGQLRQHSGSVLHGQQNVAGAERVVAQQQPVMSMEKIERQRKLKQQAASILERKQRLGREENISLAKNVAVAQPSIALQQQPQPSAQQGQQSGSFSEQQQQPISFAEIQQHVEQQRQQHSLQQQRISEIEHEVPVRPMPTSSKAQITKTKQLAVPQRPNVSSPRYSPPKTRKTILLSGFVPDVAVHSPRSKSTKVAVAQRSNSAGTSSSSPTLRKTTNQGASVQPSNASRSSSTTIIENRITTNKVETAVKRVIEASIIKIGLYPGRYGFSVNGNNTPKLLTDKMEPSQMDELVAQLAVAEQPPTCLELQDTLKRMVDTKRLKIEEIFEEIQAEFAQFWFWNFVAQNDNNIQADPIIKKRLDLLFVYMRLYRKLNSALLNDSGGSGEEYTLEAVPLSKWLYMMVEKIGQKLIAMANVQKYAKASKWVAILEQLDDSLELVDLAILTTLPPGILPKQWFESNGGRPTESENLFDGTDRQALLAQFQRPWDNPWLGTDSLQKVLKLTGRKMINFRMASRLYLITKRITEELDKRGDPEWRQERAQPVEHLVAPATLVLHYHLFYNLQKSLAVQLDVAQLPKLVVQHRNNALDFLVKCNGMLKKAVNAHGRN